MVFTVYLDESKVNRWSDSPKGGREESGHRLLVGAVVVADGSSLARAVRLRAEELLADPTVWNAQPPRPGRKDRRELFAKEHFHFTHDSPSVRERGLEAMGTHEFRVHVCYSHLSWAGLSEDDLQAAMYFTLVRNLLQRYAGTHLNFVFENGSKAMHRRFGKLISHAAITLDRQNRRKARQPRATAEARIAPKPHGGLSTVDYALGVVNIGLRRLHADGKDDIKPHESALIDRLDRHIAHIANFDEAIHRRRFDILSGPSWAGHIKGTNSYSGVEKPFSTLITDSSTGPFAYVRDERTLATALGMTPSTLERAKALAQAGSSYRFPSARIRGKWRRFTVPTHDLVIGTQRRIVDLLGPLTDHLHPACSAYVPRRSAKDAAQPHCGKAWMQTLDIADFFASTSAARVEETLRALGAPVEVATALAALTTYGDALPTGTRTSPPMCNLILADFDFAMAEIAQTRSLQYTRYADDLTFSGDDRFDVSEQVSSALAGLGYELKKEKTRISRRGQSHRVAGLAVFDDTTPRVPKRLKGRLRREMFMLEKVVSAESVEWGDDEAGEDEESVVDPVSVRGLYQYVKSVEPERARKLASEYPEAGRIVAATATADQRALRIRNLIDRILQDDTPTLTTTRQQVAPPAALDEVTSS